MPKRKNETELLELLKVVLPRAVKDHGLAEKNKNPQPLKTIKVLKSRQHE